jgi:excisionase family DNA binding protein
MTFARWLKTQLAELDSIPDDFAGDYLSGVIEEAERRAAAAGLVDIVAMCQIRPGPVGVELARRVLSECLAACDTEPELLDIKRAADYLGYSVRGLRNLIKQGRIRYTRNGGGPYRFRQEWLADFAAPPATRQQPAKKRLSTPRHGFPG